METIIKLLINGQMEFSLIPLENALRINLLINIGSCSMDQSMLYGFNQWTQCLMITKNFVWTVARFSHWHPIWQWCLKSKIWLLHHQPLWVVAVWFILNHKLWELKFFSKVGFKNYLKISKIIKWLEIDLNNLFSCSKNP